MTGYSNRFFLVFMLVVASSQAHLRAETPASTSADILRPENVVAWCIVPFDAAKRGSEERAVMLKELGLHRCAYDWRQEHVASFEQEILAYQKHGIEFFAFWGVHDDAFALFEKYDLHPQIWMTLSKPRGIEPDASNEAKVELAAKQMAPLAERTKAMGCQLGLYNHGGWGGEPENMVAVCKRMAELGHSNVGIVYNFHHGHEHIHDWAGSFAKMQPHLLCVNLNGMNGSGAPKILGIGKGMHEREMVQSMLASNYHGAIGIIDHRNELDAKESLQENLSGLAQLREKILSR